MPNLRKTEDVIDVIESKGWRWDVGMISHDTYEARIWKWPNVIGRSRYTEKVPVFNMLKDALEEAEAEGR